MSSDGSTWFFSRLAEHHGRPEALVWRDRPFSYEWLSRTVDEWTSTLSKHGLTTGNVVSFISDYSPHSTALFLALLKQGHIMVPMSLTLTDREIEERTCLTGVQYEVRFEPDGRGRVTERNANERTHDLVEGLRRDRTPGLVVFSSGSSGETKAILHDMTKVLRKFRWRRHTMRAITFLLLDHLGGINTLLYILSNGGTVVTVEDRSPSTVCETIERHRVELLPTTPSFLNLLLLSEAYRSFDLSSLKTISYGTEPMPHSTRARMAHLFPEAKLLQTYGLSEIGVLRTRSRGNDSRWFKAGGEGIELKVVDGELLIRADSSMLGYLNLPSPFDDEGFFHTGDLVECDGEYITILGRRTDVINVGGQKVFPAEVESIILDLPEIDDVTVSGERNILTGEVVVARVSTSRDLPPRDVKARVRAACAAQLSEYKVPAKVVVNRGVEYSPRFKKVRRPHDGDNCHG